MAYLEFYNNSAEVKGRLEQACNGWLYEAGGELEAQVKRNTPVDTGQLKSSWNYTVAEYKQEAMVGSNLQNAVWNEFGTGEYALHGDGRKGGWYYEDSKGEGHFTHGKRPQRSLFYAFASLKNKLQRALESKLKGLR